MAIKAGSPDSASTACANKQRRLKYRRSGSAVTCFTAHHHRLASSSESEAGSNKPLNQARKNDKGLITLITLAGHLAVAQTRQVLTLMESSWGCNNPNAPPSCNSELFHIKAIVSAYLCLRIVYNIAASSKHCILCVEFISSHDNLSSLL